MDKFTDYLVTVLAVGAGIVGLKVVVGILSSKTESKVIDSINKVFQMM